MKTYRLEYRPSADLEESNWHIEKERPGAHVADTNGWYTIASGLPDLEMIEAFTEHINDLYNCVCDDEPDAIQRLFEVFKTGWDRRQGYQVVSDVDAYPALFFNKAIRSWVKVDNGNCPGWEYSLKDN